ncbi:glutamate racemase [Fodinicurvata halophila]|uniref:glutamate racemase n=1 Tax=Fodinicurvata halophila TaxID=1419723 RepID=UPI00362BECFE
MLILDSGIGGLSVLKEIRRALPQAEVIYLADTAAFPHSDQNEEALVERLAALLEVLLASGRPDLVLVTGSTASSLALPQLQARFDLPIMGCQPALETAVEMTQAGCIGLLETETTRRQPARRDWIERVAAGCRVVRVGARRLAGLAERRFRGLSMDRALLARESGALFPSRSPQSPMPWSWAHPTTGSYWKSCAG